MITHAQSDELAALAKPVVAWLNDNCNLHTIVIVEPDGVTLSEGIAYTPITEYIGD